MTKFIVSLAAAAIPFAGFSAVLVNHPSLDPEGYISDSFSSGGQYYEVTEADDFTLATGATIQSIQFFGGSEYFINDDLTNMVSFQVRILDSSFNPVFDVTGSTASLTPTPTGVTTSYGAIEYALTMNTNFSLAAGSYYLNIGATIADNDSDSFVWSLSNPAPAVNYINFFDADGWQASADGDLAFVISGQPVPEPATMAALSLGIVAMLRRRK